MAGKQKFGHDAVLDLGPPVNVLVLLLSGLSKLDQFLSNRQRLSAIKSPYLLGPFRRDLGCHFDAAQIISQAAGQSTNRRTRLKVRLLVEA